MKRMSCKISHNFHLIYLLLFTLSTLLQTILAVDFTVINNATTTQGGIVFTKQIGNSYAQQTLSNATNFIWQIFQETKDSDRKAVDQVDLIIVPSLPPNLLAVTGNNQIQISSERLAGYTGDVKTEFTGVIYHEMTHIWQWNGNGQANSGLIEGIADYVRLKLKNIPIGWAQPGDGSSWDEGYITTAWFLDYCDGLMSGFVVQINKKMKDGYSDDFFQDLLGKSVDQLWSDYINYGTVSPSSAPPPTSNAPKTVTGTVIHSPSSTPSRSSAVSPSSAPPTTNATGTGAQTAILSPSSTPSRNSGNNERLKVIAIVTTVSGTVILVAIVCFLCRRKARKAKRYNTSLDILEGNQNLEKFEELPLFKFEKLSAATNNFQGSNKLGQGGFGPVYKGKLEDGQEVAIKRLSGTSRQGAEEFMNEVLVISKLQHRNLVKLLGCCAEGLERMLIYEYMPNKSLDAFLFDPQQKGNLDWKKRYTIIEGISRGLLYLHRDSRLKIIHRDLKAANILLDENLNPKISDFGMARIFGGTQIEADTTRVVGTYGYMPPEYAIEGRFSEKSDVFSFGVLLLEIITGKKTRWFDETSLSLLGYVWKQWNEDNEISLIDPIIAYQGFETEISKCIHVGLLCVQEYAQDRPDISDVIAKLGASSTRTFPKPKQPGFTRFMRDTCTSTQSQPPSCTNDLSITNISGR